MVWHKVRKIKGTWSLCTISGLLIHGSIETAPGAIVDELTSHFASVSCSNHYSPTFQLIKVKEESKVLDFCTASSDDYNLSFTLSELQSSLSCAHNTAPGPDHIHNSILKNLPATALHFFLSLYNRIWLDHTLPDRWQEAIIIPIAKPEKDRSLSSSYRPISLTSCLCKIMERMVNRRLLWLLEQRNLLTNTQCGFRKHRSTLDHLVSISTRISNSFVLQEHLVAVFFDLGKAYDTTWRYGILRTLHSWGFRGCLPLFYKSFSQIDLLEFV